MLNLAELEQFVAFAELGTLSRAAEQLHISQPTITRTMRHVEDAFGVSLFQRGKNRIELNETGRQPGARDARYPRQRRIFLANIPDPGTMCGRY